MFNIILYQPEIPPNTGNIIRLCANTGARLHLIGPLGFELDDRRLQRAGLDYHEFARIKQYDDWAGYLASNPGFRLIGFTTKSKNNYSNFRYQQWDGLMFGPETRGLPELVRATIGKDQLLRLPMKSASRSLNLSNTAAVVLYEAWRQLGFEGSGTT